LVFKEIPFESRYDHVERDHGGVAKELVENITLFLRVKDIIGV